MTTLYHTLTRSAVGTRWFEWLTPLPYRILCAGLFVRTPCAGRTLPEARSPFVVLVLFFFLQSAAQDSVLGGRWRTQTDPGTVAADDDASQSFSLKWSDSRTKDTARYEHRRSGSALVQRPQPWFPGWIFCSRSTVHVGYWSELVDTFMYGTKYEHSAFCVYILLNFIN